MTTCDRIAVQARARIEKAVASLTGPDLFEALAQLHRNAATRHSAEGFEDLARAERTLVADYEERATRLRAGEQT